MYCVMRASITSTDVMVRECHALWVSDLVHYKCRLMSD